MLFGKRKKVLPPLISDEELDRATGINADTVLDFLIGLSGDDYTKICQVASLHRQANYEAAKVLGLPDEPITFLVNPRDDSPAFEATPVKKTGAKK